MSTYLELQRQQGKWTGGDLRILNEQISGSVPFHKRPRGSELLGTLQTGDVLVIAKLDRGWRSSKDFLTCIDDFKKRGVALHLVDMNGDVCDGISQLVVTIMSAVAQWERERIGERTREAKREQARKGLYVGGKIPWDKKLVNGKLIDDPKKHALVKNLRTWRSQGVTLRDCQQRVKTRGFPISTEAIRRLSDDVRNESAKKRGPRANVAQDGGDV